MAFDGITVRALVHEFNQTISGGGISRIIQSEKDELMITIKSNKVPYLLLMSANASLPLIMLTPEKKEAPLTAPNFCMLLRKHIQGGQIMRIYQPSLERVIVFEIQHRDELGDLRMKKLIVELMGKYSNIIFTDENDVIIDSIKRIPANVSSVREVLPGRTWFIPETKGKEDPLSLTAERFDEVLSTASGDLSHALYGAFTGISPLAAEEFLFEAETDGRIPYRELDSDQKMRLTSVFLNKMTEIEKGAFSLSVVSKDGEPKEFAAFPLKMYAHDPFETSLYESASEMLRDYYGKKEKVTRIRQKSADLRHLVSTALDRTNRKYQLQEKQMKSTEKRDQYRIYGEMLNTFGYECEEGAKSFTCINYYTNEEITIPLEPTESAAKNAQRYFNRYNKLKRTAEALVEQIEETANDREQLEAIMTSIDLAETETDLNEIRRELTDFGFAQKKAAVKKGLKRESKSLPYSFISSDGYEMLVGKNNYQNEELTFKIAGNSDWWFHAKGAPGSHVIVKSKGQELPDRTFEEAGALAAYFSSERSAPKVEIDYTIRRNLKKKNGGKPGFVIYHTNYSLMAIPDISGIRRKQ